MTTASMLLGKEYRPQSNSSFVKRPYPVALHKLVIEQQPKFEALSTLRVFAKQPFYLPSCGSCQDFRFLSFLLGLQGFPPFPENRSVGGRIGMVAMKSFHSVLISLSRWLVSCEQDSGWSGYSQGLRKKDILGILPSHLLYVLSLNAIAHSDQ